MDFLQLQLRPCSLAFLLLWQTSWGSDLRPLSLSVFYNFWSSRRATGLVGLRVFCRPQLARLLVPVDTWRPSVLPRRFLLRVDDGLSRKLWSYGGQRFNRNVPRNLVAMRFGSSLNGTGHWHLQPVGPWQFSACRQLTTHEVSTLNERFQSTRMLKKHLQSSKRG